MHSFGKAPERMSGEDHATSPSLQNLVPSGDGESVFLMRSGITGELREVMSRDSYGIVIVRPAMLGTVEQASAVLGKR